MKKNILCLIICAAWFGNGAFSQGDSSMKAMVAYMTPGTVQQMLARSVGTWSATVNYWMAPGGKPTTSSMQATYDTILGGRYLESKNTGMMMGMPFEGRSIIGFDNAKKIFVSNWIDNMGTGMEYMEGTWDNASKSINFKGSMVDPISGKDIPFREVLQFKDNNSQSMVMYNRDAGGKEYKSMEILFTRK